MISFQEFIERMDSELNMSIEPNRRRKNPFFIVEFVKDGGGYYSPLSIVGLKKDRHFEPTLMFFYTEKEYTSKCSPNPFMYSDSWVVTSLAAPGLNSGGLRVRITGKDTVRRRR